MLLWLIICTLHLYLQTEFLNYFTFGWAYSLFYLQWINPSDERDYLNIIHLIWIQDVSSENNQLAEMFRYSKSSLVVSVSKKICPILISGVQSSICQSCPSFTRREINDPICPQVLTAICKRQTFETSSPEWMMTAMSWNIILTATRPVELVTDNFDNRRILCHQFPTVKLPCRYFVPPTRKFRIIPCVRSNMERFFKILTVLLNSRYRPTSANFQRVEFLLNPRSHRFRNLPRYVISILRTFRFHGTRFFCISLELSRG